MKDEVRQVQPQDDAIGEAWVRDTVDQLRRVSASHVHGPFDPPVWFVGVAALEFVRDDPYETVFRIRIEDALRRVPGVTRVGEHDREHCFVEGQPSGKALVEAVARIIDKLDARTREEIGWDRPRP
jgi:hypothetical protein